jgi:hypothetical protein
MTSEDLTLDPATRLASCEERPGWPVDASTVAGTGRRLLHAEAEVKRLRARGGRGDGGRWEMSATTADVLEGRAAWSVEQGDVLAWLASSAWTSAGVRWTWRAGVSRASLLLSFHRTT